MAKKSGSSSNLSLARVGGFLAFVALFVSGVIFVLRWLIVDVFKGNFDAGIFGVIANWSLLISVIISGFIFLVTTKFKNRLVWTILFWVFAALAVLGYIL